MENIKILKLAVMFYLKKGIGSYKYLEFTLQEVLDRTVGQKKQHIDYSTTLEVLKQ